MMNVYIASGIGAAAVVALFVLGHLAQKKGGVYTGALAVCFCSLALAGGLFYWRVNADDARVDKQIAARQKARREAAVAAVRPLDIVVQKAAGRLGVGGMEYSLWLRNDDKTSWTGSISIRAENTAGQRVAWDVWNPVTIPAGEVKGFSLRGRPGDRLIWACKSLNKRVAGQTTRISL